MKACAESCTTSVVSGDHEHCSVSPILPFLFLRLVVCVAKSILSLWRYTSYVITNRSNSGGRWLRWAQSVNLFGAGRVHRFFLPNPAMLLLCSLIATCDETFSSALGHPAENLNPDTQENYCTFTANRLRCYLSPKHLDSFGRV